MKNYLVAAFEKTIRQRFPAQEAELKRAMERRLEELRAENAGASKECQQHLEAQILPGIAIYETLQTVLPKEEALQCVHGFVEERAWKLRAVFRGLLKLPGLYRKLPVVFSKGVAKLFGEAAGFSAVTLEASADAIRFDMMQCPYHDACVQYGCPELCPSFCDSDDVTYGDLHPKLVWHRTKTLGRGQDRCDFGLKIKEETR